ncbi:hypothetical protein J5991_02590 [Methanocorpusculum sp.]|nr:hypothetical protein [Methanocorpusculum sp.]
MEDFAPEDLFIGLAVGIIGLAILIVAIILAVGIIDPISPVEDNSTTKPNDIIELFSILGDENSQFIKIGDESVLNGNSRVMYFADRKTGVEYVMIRGELTPRYHANGTLITHPELINSSFFSTSF